MKTTYQDSPLKKRFVIASIGMAMLFMAVGTYGSFNPTDLGFYTSIGVGVMWFYLSYYGFKWVRGK